MQNGIKINRWCVFQFCAVNRLILPYEKEHMCPNKITSQKRERKQIKIQTKVYTKNVHLNRGKCDGAWDFWGKHNYNMQKDDKIGIL